MNRGSWLDARTETMTVFRWLGIDERDQFGTNILPVNMADKGPKHVYDQLGVY